MDRQTDRRVVRVPEARCVALRYYSPALMQKAGRTAPFQAMHILSEARYDSVSSVAEGPTHQSIKHAQCLRWNFRSRLWVYISYVGRAH